MYGARRFRSANEQPDLADAQTRLQNSYLRLNELVGVQPSARSSGRHFEISGRLEYLPRRPDLTECLAFASTSRHEIKARQLAVEIEDQQLIIDRAELKPRIEAFTGYEVYSERDPEVGGNFNHGYVIGLNASWHIFDGYATRGRIMATQARREAAVLALQAQQLAVESEVRSAFFDLQQANRILESETQNVQNASESLEIARSNLSAGLGTQLDVLQAAADVTRVRTTRLSAIYLHNVALGASRPRHGARAGATRLRGENRHARRCAAAGAGVRDRAAAFVVRRSEMKTPVVLRCVIIAAGLCVISAAPAVTLDAALARVVAHNPAIQQAKAQLEQAAGRRMVLRAVALPNARTLTPAGVQGGERAGEDRVQPFAFGRGELTQPLFNVAIPASYRRGNIELLLAQQRLNVATIEQLHAARVAFYTAAYQQSLRGLAEEQRLRLEANVRAQSDRYETGTAQRGALNVARVLEQELTPRIEESRRIGNGALLTLAQLMGEDLGRGRELPAAEGELRYSAFEFDVETTAATALAQRADLKLARLLIRAAAEDQRIIEAQYYPALAGDAFGRLHPCFRNPTRQRRLRAALRRHYFIRDARRRSLHVARRRQRKVGGAALRQRAIREMNELVLAKLEAAVPRELTRLQNNLRALGHAAHGAHPRLHFGGTIRRRRAEQPHRRSFIAAGIPHRESSFLQSKAGVLAVAFEQNVARAELDRITGRYFQFSDDTKAKLH
jgi:outer membrane protein TolC